MMLLVTGRLLRRLSLALVCIIALSTLLPVPAQAHPSDFRTLTVDLLFGPEGLEAVDAAVVEAAGPSYEPFPSQQLKHSVAENVLAALGTTDASASIDAESSQRYHEVGFLITFEEPRPGQRGAFRFDTSSLQQIAANTNLDWVKLSVCAENSQTFNRLEIKATTAGRAPIDNNSERPWCQIWRLGIEDAPVAIRVRSSALPATGFPAFPMGIAGLVCLIGGLLVLRREHTTSLMSVEPILGCGHIIDDGSI